MPIFLDQMPMGVVTGTYDNLVNSRLRTTNLTQAELATANGNRFGFNKTFSNFDTATPLYVLIENPSESGVVLALEYRRLKSDTSGITDFQILWDYDVSSATKISIPVFNQNNLFRTTNVSVIETSVLNTMSATPDAGNWVISGAATITDEGIERESDFIPTSGVGNNSSGDIASELGFRYYEAGTGALIKITSGSNDNRLIFGYDWFEIPESEFTAYV